MTRWHAGTGGVYRPHTIIRPPEPSVAALDLEAPPGGQTITANGIETPLGILTLGQAREAARRSMAASLTLWSASMERTVTDLAEDVTMAWEAPHADEDN